MAITLKTLASFTFGNGGFPGGTLVMDSGGNLFGTTSRGGASGRNDGVVFEIKASSGQITDLYDFDASTDVGATPLGSLTMDASGVLYGTTSTGDNGSGSAFALVQFRGGYSPITLAQLGGTAGRSPASGLYLAPDGTVIGTTQTGGANNSGTVFTIAPNGTTAVGTPFPAGASGSFPLSAPIAYGGLLYSTTRGDETTSQPGSIFAFDPATATISTVATFNTTTGFDPESGVVADSAGNLYGTTRYGGGQGAGSIYEYDAASHAIKVLASFDATTGDRPFGNLLQDSAGNLFGTASMDGANGNGTIFELKAGSSTITVLHSFAANGSDGAAPFGGLIADQAGNLYGVTDGGGASNFGSVFELQGTDYVVCFASGTCIRTSRGDVPVQALVVGDVVVTVSGATRRIRWLGHRTIDCRLHPRSGDVHPVRVAANAFGHGLPERDLFLSPGHPVLVGADADGAGGHLVPIMCLINGTSIERVPVDTVTYWHVELDRHDILLAEGLPAESYLDWGDRGFFTEGGDHALANPEFVVPGLAGRCRPVAIDGPIVEAERRRLDAVFAMGLAEACAWPEHADDALFMDVTVGQQPDGLGRVWSPVDTPVYRT